MNNQELTGKELKELLKYHRDSPLSIKCMACEGKCYSKITLPFNKKVDITCERCRSSGLEFYYYYTNIFLIFEGKDTDSQANELVQALFNEFLEKISLRFNSQNIPFDVLLSYVDRCRKDLGIIDINHLTAYHPDDKISVTGGHKCIKTLFLALGREPVIKCLHCHRISKSSKVLKNEQK